VARTTTVIRTAMITRRPIPAIRMSTATTHTTRIPTKPATRPAAGSGCCWIASMTTPSTSAPRPAPEGPATERLAAERPGAERPGAERSAAERPGAERLAAERPATDLPAPALLRLLQLVSPALPIGGFNFSQGLEYAIEAGWVRDEASALGWIAGLMGASVGTLDVPVLRRLHQAASSNDAAAVDIWSRFLIASRETSELRAEDRHLGRSLAKVLAEAGLEEARSWQTRPDATFATLFALACSHWRIGVDQCAWGYLWTWAENQVLAAVKTVPLGQTAGQRMLDALIAQIPPVARSAAKLEAENIGSAAPMHLIASAAHETQYTRLFRS
jgi:urease accessory protein